MSSKWNFLLILSFLSLSFLCLTETDGILFSHNYYELRLTAPKLAVRRWKGAKKKKYKKKTNMQTLCNCLNSEIWK